MKKRDKLNKKRAKMVMCRYAKRCKKLRQRALRTQNSRDMLRWGIAETVLMITVLDATRALKQIKIMYKGEK